MSAILHLRHHDSKAHQSSRKAVGLVDNASAKHVVRERLFQQVG
jgi:hypothetical protein